MELTFYVNFTFYDKVKQQKSLIFDVEKSEITERKQQV